MLKILGGFVLGLIFIAFAGYIMAPGLMFHERVSPYGLEETVARIQQNIESTGNGWSLSGLRNPAKAVQSDGSNTLPVLMIEACSTKYSAPILKDDSVRYLSILMPCKISVYKKNDGKTYIGNMNAGLMGRMFGPMVGEVMSHVAADQAKFLEFDPNKPAPQMKVGTPGGGGAAGGAGAGGGGC
jgi:uncharacterized protein (DUF302 family)